MTEAWLRGPVTGVPESLMPAAHALVDAREEIEAAAGGLGPALLWTRPGGVASVGFHLRHVVGSLDRLLTYARGEALSAEQLRALALEGDPGDPPEGVGPLLVALGSAVDGALDVLRATPEGTLGDARKVGRAGLPSTVRGLLFHAAEHTRRHAGQVVATAGILKAGAAWPDPRLVPVPDEPEEAPASAVVVRRARSADAPTLARMRRLLWPDSEEDEVTALLEGPAPPTATLVAADPRGVLLGFAEVGLRSYAEGCTASPVAYLEGIWVDVDARRRGVGAALVRAAGRWAGAAGSSELASDVGPTHDASLAFHGAMGFEEVDRVVCFRSAGSGPQGPVSDHG